MDDIDSFNESLMGLSREHVQIMRYVTLKITCGEGANAKTIDLKYLILDIMSPYNIILGSLTINSLGAVVSTRYLTLKYLFINGKVGTIRGDQQVARECYLSSLETAREKLALVDAQPS